MNNVKTLLLLVTLTLILIWAGASLGGKQGMTGYVQGEESYRVGGT